MYNDLSELVDCPFDPGHQIRPARFIYHIAKCQKVTFFIYTSKFKLITGCWNDPSIYNYLIGRMKPGFLRVWLLFIARRALGPGL